LILNKQILRI